MAAPDAALLQIFREETEERLARVSDTLLALESGAAAPQAVDSLFRDVHSIKGNAGMVGFDEARALAHSMEDTLEGSRENGVVTAETIQALLAAADEIARSVAGDGGPSASPDQSQEKSPPPETEPTTPVSQPSASPSIRVSTSKVDDLLDVVGEAAVHGRRMEHLLGSGGWRREPGRRARPRRAPGRRPAGRRARAPHAAPVLRDGAPPAPSGTSRRRRARRWSSCSPAPTRSSTAPCWTDCRRP